jgi:hypothetical protein
LSGNIFLIFVCVFQRKFDENIFFHTFTPQSLKQCIRTMNKKALVTQCMTHYFLTSEGLVSDGQGADIQSFTPPPPPRILTLAECLRTSTIPVGLLPVTRLLVVSIRGILHIARLSASLFLKKNSGTAGNDPPAGGDLPIVGKLNDEQLMCGKGVSGRL